MALAHLLVLAAFAVSLAGAATALSAESEDASVCGGRNLVEVLAAETPQRLEIVRAEAAEVVNGDSVFWKVTKPGLADSWLFGTMHSADPRINSLPADVRKAFEQSGSVLIESTETLEPRNTMQKMIELKDLAFLPEGSELERLVETDQRETLRKAVEARQMPWVLANRMQPWMVAAAIATPVCESHAKQAGGNVLDTEIGLEARALGKTLVGLETIEEQFRAVAGIPDEFHVNALNETLRMGAIGDDMMETTKLLYLQGNTGMLLPLVRAFAPRTYEGKGNAEFQELLLTRRNHLMVERAAPHLQAGNAFMAVGALHLPGAEGLVQLLRQAEFSVEPVPRAAVN